MFKMFPLGGNGPGRARRARRPGETPAAAEVLEERRMPSAAPVTVSSVAADLRNGYLVVRGTSGNDDIEIRRTTTGGINVWVDAGSGYSKIKSFSGSGVSKIVVDAAGGNDYVKIWDSFTLKTRLFGGSGNDDIYGGGGFDAIYGGSGDDDLFGRGSGDEIYGGAGSDDIDGGDGSDKEVLGSPTDRTDTLSGVESDVLRLVNQQRASWGMGSLTSDSRLNRAADEHSDNMADARTRSVALWGNDLPTISARYDWVGFDHSVALENVASGQGLTAAGAVNLWMSDARLRAAILDPNVTHVGVGFDTDSSGVRYYTLSLARKA